MSGFSNPIIGGGGGLVYPSIHSPNFVHGSAGWSINKDGSLEANNATIRNGAIISGNSLYYSTPTPQLGTIIAGIASSNGIDPAGNHYLRGVFGYFGSLGTHPTMAYGLDPQFAAIDFYTWNGAAWVAGAEIAQDGTGRLTLVAAGSAAVAVNAPLTVLEAITATGGTAANPTLIETDAWQTAALINGFTGSLQYRLMPDGTVAVYGEVTTPAASFNFVNINSAPAAAYGAYQGVAISPPLTAYDNATSSPVLLKVFGNGQMQFLDSVASHLNVINGRYPVL